FLIIVLTVVLMVVGIAGAARRLLGVRFGIVRLVLAGGLAVWVSGPLSRAVVGGVPPGSSGAAPLWFLLLAIVGSLLVAMVFLVVAEALAPSGSVMPIVWLRGMRSRLSRTRRYSRILAIAVRHGLGPYLRGRGRTDPESRAQLARSIRRALDEGGLTFVKLGQVLSTRDDLLPPEFVVELGQLRDRAAPVPWPQVDAVLQEELGAPVDDVFAELDRQPLAAASVAQVHAGRLPSGAEVVVKVQRPGIGGVVERDLAIVERLARTLQTRTRWGRVTGTVELARGFAESIREELDFRVEARNMAAVLAAAKETSADAGTDAVVYPLPYEPLCTTRVLVMDRLHGRPMREAAAQITADGLDRNRLARALLETLLSQIMVSGVFHADPHPGNVLLLTDGRLGLLDFGSVGRLDAGLREALQRLLVAVDRADPAGVADALLDAVGRPDEVDTERLERALGQFMARHLSPGAPPGMQMFADLIVLVSRHGIGVPAELAAVFRALSTLEGGLTEVSPGFDMVSAARAFAAREFGARLHPDALRRAAADELTALLPMLRRLPRRVERIVAATEHGRLSVNVRLLADSRDRRHITGLLHQILLTILAATAGIMAVLLLGLAGGPKVTADVTLYQVFGYNLLAISAVMALRVLVSIFRADATDPPNGP
ncbi:MAG TPA: AarF/UbiB family protein, partial [Pilimelia sp.]|nr:AarF/UbiB family protein [Pilimelia sp.]